METRELLEAVIQIINPREKATSDRVRNLNGRMVDYTNEEILGAAEALTRSQWHKDNNQMSVDNLIRPSKFGRWYNAYMEDLNVNMFEQDDMVLRRMGGGNESHA